MNETTETTETTDTPSSRSTFLRRVAVTVGAAVGVAAFPSAAHAVNNCCRASFGQCQSEPPCDNGKEYFYCTCPGGDNYCICQPTGGTACYMGAC
jgi:hypothetical protein